MDVFRVLAAILHLGNVQVAALSSERSSIRVSHVSGHPWLQQAGTEPLPWEQGNGISRGRSAVRLLPRTGSWTHPLSARCPVWTALSQAPQSRSEPNQSGTLRSGASRGLCPRKCDKHSGSFLFEVEGSPQFPGVCWHRSATGFPLECPRIRGFLTSSLPGPQRWAQEKRRACRSSRLGLGLRVASWLASGLLQR